ncbi:hypothetical protein F5B18DRAFT_669254 [Nemania serpens]|nr:hypothetical protein F5B18DRAFT_669254 [Nemania serpens]
MLDQVTSLGREEEAWEPDTPPAQARPEKQYRCSQCPSSFKRPENLKRHQRGHDDHSRFTCQICDKSFSRSDILGRHAAIHDRRERQNENPQRRRACRECARVRERCSRGEPCRRCAIKALHCLYPDEPPSKPATSQTWSSSASESGDYDAAGLGWFGPQTTLETPNLAAAEEDSFFSLPFPSSQWPVEALSVSYGLPAIPSAWPHKNCHSYQLSHHEETPAASFFDFDAVAPSDERLHYYPGSTSEIGLKDTRFLPSNAESDGMSGVVYDQTANNMPSNMPLSCSDKITTHHQLDSSAEVLQGHYIYRAPPPVRQLGIPFCEQDIHTSAPSTYAPILDEYETLNCSNASEDYDNPAVNSSQAPGADFDHHETFLQPPTAFYPRQADPRLYGFISPDFAEGFAEAGHPMI